MSKDLYVEKYRPQTIDEIVLESNTKNLIKSYIENGTTNHLLLAGRAGIGKTSLAKIISKELNSDEKYINASMDNNVENIRNNVREFCDAMSIDGNLKIVILDEADALSSNSGTGSSAQDALRNLIETAQDDTRFILTCNFINKIIEPIKSRCIPLNLAFSIEDVIKRINFILKSENIKYDKENLIKFINMVVKKKYPDIRLIIGELQNWCTTGTLTPIEMEINEYDEIIDYIIKTPLVKNIRQYLMDNETLFNRDYISLAENYFNRLEDATHMISAADHIYRMQSVGDVEIEFTAMLLETGKEYK
jgi:DNA polymerase III delta prime subunit